jgi:electron transfer flavoprotein beta subunit
MNSIVFIKQIVQFYLHSVIDPKTNGMVKEGFVRTINPYDEVALECAIRLKEKTGKGQVTIVTLGPEVSDEVLRWGMSLGADTAIHILDDEDLLKDPLIVAAILAETVREFAYDALFFGKMALDDEFGVVGTYVADLLGLPVVTAVSEFKISEPGKDVIVQRALERGNREEVSCPLPAVFTVDMSLGRPRYPTFPERKRAAREDIGTLDAKVISKRACLDVRSPDLVIKSLAQPKLRPKKILAPDSGLSAAGRIQFVMSGGMGKKGGDKVGGDPEKTAGAIFDFLKEKKFLPESKDRPEERKNASE